MSDDEGIVENGNNKYKEEDVSKELEEVTTDQHYREIEETEIDFILEGEEFYKYQNQMLTKMIEAEDLPPIISERGEFYSRVAVNACAAGAGKTAAALALCIGIPEVEKPKVSMSGYSSSLVSMLLSDEDQREYIPTSVVVCPNPLANSAWKKNCNKFFGPEYYYIIDSYSEMGKTAAKEGFDAGNEGGVEELTNITKKITSIKGKIKRGTVSPQELNLLPQLETRKIELRGGKRVKVTSETMDPATMEFIVDKMRNYPVIICPASSFQYLIPIFKKYEVSRLFIDELQVISITNQKEMIGYLINPIIDHLVRSKTKKHIVNTYREKSPARMIWLITATPHQMTEREDADHFVNSWLARNAPFLSDYNNSVTGNYMFPEMIERYIIKFPKSYIDELKYGGRNFCNEITIKVNRPQVLAVLNGVMGDEFDTLLQNDGYEEIMKKLNLEGVSISDPDLEIKIIVASIEKLNAEIAEIDYREAGYKKGGTNAQLEANDEQRRKIREKINVIELKMKALQTIQSIANGEELEDPEAAQCMICYGDLEEEILSCPQCWGFYHPECILKWFKKTGAAKTCPKCRKPYNSVKDLCILKSNGAGNEDGDAKFDFVHQDDEKNEDEEMKFETKLDAIKTLLNDDYNFRKTLLYLNSSDESNTDVNVIRALLNMKLHVFYDKSMTKAQASFLFGPNAETYLHCITNRKKMEDYINKFEKAKNRCVFIMQTNAQSTGLDFPFIDCIICYSKFKPGTIDQIKGRAERASRTEEYAYIVLEYEN